MTKNPPAISVSRPKDKDVATTKSDFIAAAHAASPLRAVEKYPWTAVGATAAATLGVTVVASSTLFGKSAGGLFSGLLALATVVLKSPIAGSALQGVTTGLTNKAVQPAPPAAPTPSPS